MDQTGICNLALVHVGNRQITSIDAEEQAARICKALYDQTLDEMLRMHPWNFAIKRATLSAFVDAPLSGWAYQYGLPADFMRSVQLNGYEADEIRSDYQIENGRLLTDYDIAQLRYVAKITDPTLYDPLFIEAFALKLASKIAVPLTGNRELGPQFNAEFNSIALPRARRIDAAEDRKKRKPWFIESDVVRARYQRGA